MSKPKLKINDDFKYKVYISDDDTATNTLAALSWLTVRGFERWLHYELHTNYPIEGNTTFYFWDKELATEFSLSI